MRNSKALNTE
ncbi:unnamed protein product [Linum tenue]|uniref:Uncharacterized protein n=1 Tax=Linum tenue TaxID=586396 RepID=A0AAV0N5H1_9ROSI|nr:unnamed protein product [Linum tenue]